MPKDIFGKGRGPTREEIEREAAREVERLTRPPAPPPDFSGGGFGPKSPLEQMAEELAERRQTRGRRRRSTPESTEDRAGFGAFQARRPSPGR